MKLEELLEHCERKIERLSKFQHLNEFGKKELEEHNMTMKLCVRAIPMKPVIKHERERAYDWNGNWDIVVKEWAECPTCGECLPIEKQKFCYECGQAIDYSGVMK